MPQRFKETSAYEKSEEIVFKIPFTGNPKPSVQWLRDNKAVSGRRFNIDVTERHAFLTIKGAEKEDSGPWRLSLENDLGSDSAIIKIQINGRCYFVWYMHNISYWYGGLFMFEVRWFGCL